MSSQPDLKSLSTDQLVRLFPALTQKLDLKKHFSLVSGGLSEIEDRINRQAREFDPAIIGYVEYATESKGKRIRPALVLLTAHATGGVNNGHRDLAVIVELIHLATLVHDDIMDGASKRRNQPTAYAKWGAELSVLLGDCLFSHALKLCTNFDTKEVSRQIADAASEVCSGEILQTQRRFDLKLSIPDYLKVISMKTGALFRVSTELASFLNEVPKDVQAACRTYGDCLGIAYQIYDDCLDIIGTESSIGKTVGTDLEKGKLTLPILHVLQQDLGEDRAELCKMISSGSEEDRLRLLATVIDRGGLRYSVRKIQSYLDEAIKALDILPPSDFRDTLQKVPQALTDHVATLGK